ncbi:MAG: ABC transporter ATP-binding protein [Planctomycetes bacterium]|jgi:ABC-2 type transport system ATP-binding protein|nr:ABC transporter ATP-binding protein [Planctomycetota bacterium]
MADPPVVIRGLARRFRKVEALRDLDLEVPEGSIFGLLGPNGSGKTTALRILLGLLRADAGRASVWGEDSLSLSAATRQRIGYLSEEPFPYDDLPIDDLLLFISAFFDRFDHVRAGALRDRLRIPRDQALAELSAGQRRRAELVLALAPDPDLLVLDDPLAGLDATVRREFLDLVLEFSRREGKTVLFTSHVLTDVERVADTVGFLVGGSMRLVAPLDDLKERVRRLVIETESAEPKIPGELSRRSVPGGVAVVTAGFGEPLLADLRARYGRVHAEELGLEEIFLAVTGGPAEAAP